MKYNFDLGIECAKKMDEEDPLRNIIDRFYKVPGQIYMDGNSLGLCSKDAEKCTLELLDVWKNEGINIWNVKDSKYFLYPSLLGGRMAKLINADSAEVTVTNSTTINIHQCIATLYHPTATRYKILVDDLNFPTDRYAIDSQARIHGYTVEEAVKIVPSPDGRMISEDAVIEAMTDDVAIALLPAVLYRSAQLLDMERVTKIAKERGIIIGWDLCHSIGAVPHDFKKIDPDFAIWCTYKYLSAGPGSIAGLYMNKRHFGKQAGLAGWHGNKKSTQFQLKQSHEQESNADGFLTGTAPMLSMAAMEGVLDIFDDAGMDRVREKSLNITAYLMYLIDQKLVKYGCEVGNPREDAIRGGHVALEHSEAYRICQDLKTRNVIPDFREPNVIRLAPTALYGTYEEVYQLVEILEDILSTKSYEKFSNTRALVV